jgi:glycerophosphoryl diester phosphodiesterase
LFSRPRATKNQRAGLNALVVVLAVVACGKTVVAPAGPGSAGPAPLVPGTPLMQATPIVIAHRGASASAPEHTFASYDLAVAQGADYLELDVQRTKDGVLVVIHDATLDRTARGPVEDCAGKVADKTMAQLRRCDAGSWFKSATPGAARPEFAGIRIPTLAEVVARYGKTSRLYIETKDPESYPGLEAELVSILKENGISAGARGSPGVFIQSFSKASLERVRALDPSLPLIQLLGATTAEDLLTRVKDAASYATGIGPSKDGVTATLVQAAHAGCLLVHPYTVDDASEMEALLAMGVDGMFTDNPELLRQVISRSPARTTASMSCTRAAR